MLTEREREYLKERHEFEGDENLKLYYAKKIRDKARAALSDLALIADNISTGQFKKVFHEDEAKRFIRSLAAPPSEPEEYDEFYKSYKLREGVLEDFESSISKWIRWQPFETRIVMTSESDLGGGISRLSEILEDHDKKHHPEERILRVCDKWVTLGKIVEETGLPREEVERIRDRLVDDRRLIVRRPSYRYKAKDALSEEEREKL